MFQCEANCRAVLEKELMAFAEWQEAEGLDASGHAEQRRTSVTKAAAPVLQYLASPIAIYKHSNFFVQLGVSELENPTVCCSKGLNCH